MKKSISIILLMALLFNVLGFYGLFMGIGYRHDLTLTDRLDNDNYDISETVTLKIPLSIPYSGDQADYNRVDGAFEHEGEFYRLVKQRYAGDTLYIVCIRDHQSKKIHQALEAYLKVVLDKSTGDSHPDATQISIIKDYCPTFFCIEVVSLGWSYNIEWSDAHRDFDASFLVSIIHPPERA